jgi:hypothetical protein
MISGFEKLIPKDSITLTDVYDLVDDISDKVCVMIRITLVIGFVLGAICMAIVDKFVG